MVSRFFRHIKEGFINISRNLAMTISSVTAVTITLLLVGVFFMVSTNITSISTSIKSNLNIVVKMDLDINEEDITVLKEKIENIDGVKTVEFSSRHEELEKQINLYPQQAEYYRRLEGENNILHDVFILEVNDAENMKAITEEISNLKGIHSANQGGDAVEKLILTLNSVQKVGWVVVAVLSFLAMYLISNTIKSTIYAQRDEIAIMRNVGASNGFIRAPYLVGGVLIGALGSLIPILVMSFGYNFVYKETGGVLISKMFVLEPVYPFVLYLGLLLLGLGVVVGFVGSFLSVTRYLRWKR